MFTEEDIEDDGKIKREAGTQMNSVARSHSEVVFKHFANVCEQMGQEPHKVLGDMLVRALNNEDYAQRILDTEITMDKINTGDYRRDDIQMVKDIADEFDLEPDRQQHPIDRLVNKRIEAVGGSPFEEVRKDGEEKKIEELERQVNELREELQRERLREADEEVEVIEPEEEEVVEEEVDDSDEKSIDELFGREDGEESEEETEEVDVEMEEIEEDEEEQEEEPEVEEPEEGEEPEEEVEEEGDDEEDMMLEVASDTEGPEEEIEEEGDESG